MTCWEFEQKLKKLNPRLYLGKNISWVFNSELGSTGIYYQDSSTKYRFTEIERRRMDGKAKKDVESSDRYVGFCTVKHVPEGNWYNENGELVSNGWREILLRLHSMQLIDIHQARKVFKTDLGNNSYDSWDHDKKAAYFIKDPPKKIETLAY